MCHFQSLDHLKLMHFDHRTFKIPWVCKLGGEEDTAVSINNEIVGKSCNHHMYSIYSMTFMHTQHFFLLPSQDKINPLCFSHNYKIYAVCLSNKYKKKIRVRNHANDWHNKYQYFTHFQEIPVFLSQSCNQLSIKRIFIFSPALALNFSNEMKKKEINKE